jgi:anti-anti-sigma factor
MPPPNAAPIEPPKPFVGAFATVRRPATAGATRLVLTGELDLVTAARARASIRRAQAESDVLICDLADLWFIDLTGLRVLLAAAADADRTGRRLLVVNAPATLCRMLRVLRLDDALETAPAPLRTRSIHSGSRAHVS